MWSSTVFPFCAVLLWTALKDLYEDRRRQRDDDAENMRRCLRYDVNAKEFVQARWIDVLCGDILLTFVDEAFPADVLLVRAANGQAYISTVNLDGETNLKERRPADLLSALCDMQEAGVEPPRGEGMSGQYRSAVLSMAAQTAGLLHQEGLKVELKAPSAVLGDMDGFALLERQSNEATAKLVSLKVKQPCALDYELFVPRGCLLRNTPYVISIAAYCGHDTKTRLNSSEPQAKFSNMQKNLNRGVQGLVATLVLFCIYATIVGAAMENDDGINPFQRFVWYWIILYQIVPISLYVGFEIIKLVLGFNIGRDPQMVDPKTNVPALARTADLVEELGQVGFVFSDKTGTLTENEMVFAHACVAGHDLGDFRTAAAKEKGGVEESLRILSNPSDALFKDVRWFFINLAVNHSAQVEMGKDGEPVFQGSSPDEVAFASAAKSVGVVFKARNRKPGSSSWDIVLQAPSQEGEIVFNVLCEIPFSSDRKRMSVVVEHKGECFVFTKGADNVMGPLCSRALDGSFVKSLSQYSKLGLRTLVIASKRVERKFITSWLERWKEAGASGEVREAKMADVAMEVEHSLDPLGITAIEDRLQDGVPAAIVSIKAAGIRFWVLTGDKTETAVEIVRACNLFDDSMRLAYMVNCSSEKHALQLLEDAEKELDTVDNGGLVIDGTFVQHVISAPQNRKFLYNLAIGTRACVCCRLSPEQKKKIG